MPRISAVPGKHVGKETAQSPLPGTAAHLFIVEEAVDLTKTGGGRGGEKPFQGGICTAEIIDAGRLKEFSLGSDANGLLTGTEDQIGGQDITVLHTEGLGQQVGKGWGPLRTVQRLHVPLKVVVVAFVHIPLLMDGEAGNGQQVTVQMDQAPLYTGGRLHHGAPATVSGRSSQEAQFMPP